MNPGTRVEWRTPGQRWQLGTVIATPSGANGAGMWLVTDQGERKFAFGRNIRKADQ